jgi:DNA-binding HxlR family transcriptional regulator
MSKGKREKWKLIKLLGEDFVLDILSSLFDSPKRFTDLADACPNEKTRADKLRKLGELGLIEAVSLKIGKRFYVHYTLTEKGRGIYQQILKIETSADQL